MTNFCDITPINRPGSVQRYATIFGFDDDLLTNNESHSSPRLRLWTDRHQESFLRLLSEEKSLIEQMIASKQKGESASFATSKNQDLLLTYHSLTIPSEDRALHTFSIDSVNTRSFFNTKEDLMRRWAKFINPLTVFEDLETWMQDAVGFMADYTGYEHVMLYKFQPSWDGQVLAEKITEGSSRTSFLGLRFPATDLPIPARQQYFIRPYRYIEDAAAEDLQLFGDFDVDGLDLSALESRSVPKIHKYYLKNMGTRSSISLGLFHENRLWGIISCHNSQPKPCDVWMRTGLNQSSKNLSSFLSAILDKNKKTSVVSYQKLQKTLYEMSIDQRKILREETILHLLVDLAALTTCHGLALLSPDVFKTSGDIPNIDSHKVFYDIVKSALASFNEKNPPENPVGFLSSIRACQEIRGYHYESHNGIFLIPLDYASKYLLVLFKRSTDRDIFWAGEKDSTLTTNGQLNPRKSFQSWRENRRDQSEDWEMTDFDIAELLSRDSLGLFLDYMNLSGLYEAELKKSNDLLDQYANTISHDFSLPLRSLIEQWQRDPETPRIREIAENLVEHAQRLLDYSRIRQKRLGVHTLTETIKIQESVIAQLNDLIKDLKIDLRWTNHVDSFLAPRSMIQQITYNLVANACKFHRQDLPREVDVSIEKIDYEQGHWISIKVKDNGVGVLASDLERIFDPHVYSPAPFNKKRGYGLGLAIVKTAVQHLSGKINLRSEVGVGSVFEVLIPFIRE